MYSRSIKTTPLLFLWALCIGLGTRAQCPDFPCPQALAFDSIAHTLSHDKARQIIQSGIAQSLKQKAWACTGNWYRRLGIRYSAQGKFAEAIPAYVQALHYSQRAGDVLAMASNQNQLGVMYYYLTRYAEAIIYFKQTAETFGKCGFYLGVADASANVAETLLLMDSTHAAYPWLNQAIAARKRSGDTSNIGADYLNLGLWYLHQKQFTPAMVYLQKAGMAFSQVHNSGGWLTVSGHQAKLYIQQGKVHEASILYQQLFDTSSRLHLLPHLQTSLAGLYQTSLLLGDSLKAFRYLQLKSALSDTLLSASQQAAFIDAERRYQARQKDLELSHKTNQLKTRNLMLLLTIILLLTIASGALLLIKLLNNRRKLLAKEAELQQTRVNELLRQQEVDTVNAILKGQHLERKRIAQDLHDRLGSMLATVKLHFTNMEESISRLQQQQDKSYTEANSLLDEACEEVRRISHDLYESALERFGFTTAINQLIAAIEKSNALHITFQSNQVNDIAFKPFEKEVYRITQELLSNTLKYAAASEVNIQLSQHGQTITFVYDDNGKGFDTTTLEQQKGIGYQNIRSRIKAIHANWHLDSTPGHGMTLIIDIPLL